LNLQETSIMCDSENNEVTMTENKKENKAAMTVADLKKLLEGYSDDTLVTFYQDGAHPILGSWDGFWNGVHTRQGGDYIVDTRFATQSEVKQYHKTLALVSHATD
jgi:hypothetical protein